VTANYGSVVLMGEDEYRALIKLLMPVERKQSGWERPEGLPPGFPSPQEQLESLNRFFQEWNAIEDEPLGDDFLEAVNSPWKFNEVDFS
jgi:hypothetical protein